MKLREEIASSVNKSDFENSQPKTVQKAVGSTKQKLDKTDNTESQEQKNEPKFLLPGVPLPDSKGN